MRKTELIALSLAGGLGASTALAQDTHLVIHVQADRTTAQPGESVQWEIWAELMNPTGVISAAVMDIGFDLDFGGQAELSISNNQFSYAFDNDLLGPSYYGTVLGDWIDDAHGINAAPPLNNADGPDSSNPLFIYRFTMEHDGSTTGNYTPLLTINGTASGAYAGAAFTEIFFYSTVDPPPSTSVIPIEFVSDTVTYIPAPATCSLALLGIAATRRRSR